MSLLAVMDAACEDITAEACRGWLQDDSYPAALQGRTLGMRSTGCPMIPSTATLFCYYTTAYSRPMCCFSVQLFFSLLYCTVL